MSTLGSLSGRLGREGELLHQFNESLLVLEADALGRQEAFDFSEAATNKARKFILDFVERLHLELIQEAPKADFQSLVFRLSSGMKPIEDWLEDLERVSRLLRTGGPLDPEIIPVLEDILSILDSNFADDLRRLYAA
jgi:hypothetical protein